MDKTELEYQDQKVCLKALVKVLSDLVGLKTKDNYCIKAAIDAILANKLDVAASIILEIANKNCGFPEEIFYVTRIIVLLYNFVTRAKVDQKEKNEHFGTLLVKAAEIGHQILVNKLSDSIFDETARNKIILRAVLKAAANNQFKAAKWLIQKIPDKNIKSKAAHMLRKRRLQCKENCKEGLKEKRDKQASDQKREENLIADVLQQIIDSVGDASTVQKYCNQAASVAAKMNRFKVAGHLISIISDVKIQDQRLREALKLATDCRELSPAKSLLKLVRKSGKKPWCPDIVTIAARRGILDIVDYFLNDLESEADKESCILESLIVAAENGHLDVVKYLHVLTRKLGDVTKKQSCYYKALYNALLGNYTDVVEFIILQESQVFNFEQFTHLAVLAAECGLTDVVEIFLYNVQNGNDKDTLNLKIALKAITCDQPEVLHRLKFKPHWLVKSSDLLDHFVRSGMLDNGDDFSLQRLLTAIKADPSQIPQLLNVCISAGHVGLTMFLLSSLKYITDVNERHTGGSTALMQAAEAGHHTIATELLKHISSSSTLEDVMTSCRAGDVRVLNVLIKLTSDFKLDELGLRIERLAEKVGNFQLLRLVPNFIPKNSLGASLISTQTDEEWDSRQSLALHELLVEAGFSVDGVKWQHQIADTLEDIARSAGQANRYLVGSFAEGWGFSISVLTGSEASIDLPETDINWTVLATGKPLHLTGGCDCKADLVDSSSKLDYADGYASVLSSVGSQPSKFLNGSLRRATESLCYAFECCRPSDRIVSEAAQRLQVSASKNMFPTKIHLVRASRPGSDRQLRVSTSFLEKSIMRSLNCVQGQLFVLIKFLFKRTLTKHWAMSGLKTYHAKTLLFCMLDKHGTKNESMWVPKNLVKLLKESMDLMLDFLTSNNLPDVCMPHFFIPGCQLYFTNAGIGGDFDQTKTRIISQLKELRGNFEKLIDSIKASFPALRTQDSNFHPFVLIPQLSFTSFPDSKPESCNARSLFEGYRVVEQCMSQLLNEDSQTCGKFNELGSILWCTSASLCLTSLWQLKICNEDEAKRIINDLTQHTVVRRSDVEINKDCSSLCNSNLDWAWRFCFPCHSKPQLKFLPNFTQSLLKVRSKSFLYVNFRCLTWSLQAELLGIKNTTDWFNEIQVDPDLDELLTVAYYSDSKEHVQWCLMRIEAIKLRDRFAFDPSDEEWKEKARLRLEQLYIRDFSGLMRTRAEPPDRWTDEKLTRECSVAGDPFRQFPPREETLLIVSAKRNRTDLVQQITSDPSNSRLISVCDAMGRSALSWVSFLGHMQTAEAFERLPRDILKDEVNRPDNLKQTPLMLAAMADHADVIRWLLHHGADLTLEDVLKNTALTHAAKCGAEKAATALLEAEASLSQKDASGNTPVLWAARKGHLGVLRILCKKLRQREDLDVKGEYRRNALQWAELGKHNDCAEFIRTWQPIHSGTEDSHEFSPPEHPENPDPGSNSAGGSSGAAAGSDTGAAGAGGSASGSSGAAGGSAGGASDLRTAKYDVASSDCKLAIVVNITKFADPRMNRPGAECDTDPSCLPRCLQKLGFTDPYLKVVRDVGEDFFDQIRAMQVFTEEEYERCSAFLLCIMSHGDIHSIDASDGARIDLMELFSSIRLQEPLKDKPKIFIIQACRQIPNPRLSHACPQLIRNALKHEDSLYIFGAVEGDPAFRDRATGSFLIQSIKEVVCDEEYADDSESLDVSEFTLMLPRVHQKVKSITKSEQIPCYKSTLMKLLFFPKV